MDNIINLNAYKWRHKMGVATGQAQKIEEATNIIGLEEQLRALNAVKHQYSLEEIEATADTLLDMFECYSKPGATPIVNIVTNFGFKAYKETLHNQLSGDISINGDTKEKYGHNKIILVNEADELFHQRFVAAHELAHYLFDFLGNPDYKDDSKIFSDSYYKNCHASPEEQRANRFAASILMPKKLFVEQYELAERLDNRKVFTLMYLSRFFETPMNSIVLRIREVMA